MLLSVSGALLRKQGVLTHSRAEHWNEMGNCKPIAQGRSNYLECRRNLGLISFLSETPKPDSNRIFLMLNPPNINRASQVQDEKGIAFLNPIRDL
jgi:hypothetical protein